MNPSQEDDDFKYDTSVGIAQPPPSGTGAADPVNEALADDVFHGSFPVRATMMLRTPLDDLLRLADAAPEMLRDLLAGRRRDDPCWAEFIARRPAFAGVAPLECVPSRDLAKLFAVRPELADRRNTNRLSGADWAFLLRRRPELDSLRSWGAMSGADWVALLCGSSRSRNVLLDEIDAPGRDAPRPELADRCRWDLLSGADWATALGEHPEWASFCNKATCGDGRNGWDLFRGADWSALLRAKPELADRCDWGRLGGRDWAALLRDRPEFADLCRVWEKIGGADAIGLAAARPELADRIVWRNLSGRDWHVLLGSHPEFWDRKPADVAVDHTAPRPRIWAPAVEAGAAGR